MKKILILAFAGSFLLSGCAEIFRQIPTSEDKPLPYPESIAITDEALESCESFIQTEGYPKKYEGVRSQLNYEPRFLSSKKTGRKYRIIPESEYKSGQFKYIEAGTYTFMRDVFAKPSPNTEIRCAKTGQILHLNNFNSNGYHLVHLISTKGGSLQVQEYRYTVDLFLFPSKTLGKEEGEKFWKIGMGNISIIP